MESQPFMECFDGKPVGFYLDINDGIYKKCYDSCKFCYGEGNETNNNCTECKSNFTFLNLTINDNDNNCYEKCEYYYYFDESNKYHCTESNICPDEYNKLIVEKNKCIDKCENDNIYKYDHNNICKKDSYECLSDNHLTVSCSMKNISNNTQIYDIIKKDILSAYSGESEKSIVVEGNDGVIYQITNNKNELDLLRGNITDDYNLTIIDLAECETLLKKEYNINENDSLIFLKQEKSANKASEKDVQYECFEPYNKTKLNLSICSEVNINIYVKLELSEETKALSEQIKELGYNMFDINDAFYQDICTPYKSSSNSDILLSDRKDYIYNNEDSKCQDNCEFTSYSLNSRYISCSCNINKETSTEKEKIDKFEAKTIYEMFYNVLKYSNYEELKCYKLVFSKSVMTKNEGSIIIIVLFGLYLGSLIFYLIKGVIPLKAMLVGIIEEKDKKINLFFPPGRKRNISVKNKENKKKKKSVKPKTDDKRPRAPSQYKFLVYNQKIEKKNSTIIFNKDNINNSLTNKTILKTTKIKNKQNQDELVMKINEIENKKKLDDFELNELEFKEAIKQDKRTFFQIYFYFIKREHRIIFTFFNCNDYNLISIKLSRFIFLFATDMAMNVFFFSDDSMHKIFLDYGKYNFIQQIPQIIYSTAVSQFIELFLCFLSLTDKHIYQIKNLDGKSKDIKKIIDIFKCIKIKLICFFIFTFIFFGFYWYIIASFCAVYENTQIAFIKDSLISFLLSILYPFILYSIPSGLRLCAIRGKNKNLECLYKLSDVIPFF